MTINLDKLNAAGAKITVELVRIRERAGASLSDYEAKDAVIEIAGGELQELARANPGKPIIVNNKLHLAYIKDHSGDWSSKEKRVSKTAANGCYYGGNKLHFYYCRTLQSMMEQGRQKRYRQTPAVVNTQPIDLPEEVNVRMCLAWCQNCIREFQSALSLRPKSTKWAKWYGDKGQVAVTGDAETLKKFFQPVNPRWQEFTAGLKSSAVASDYPPNWSEISRDFRKGKKYKCARCGVDCRAHTGLTDAHHIDGDKRNCDYSNLQCLCIYHHSQQPMHGHYKPEESNMRILRRLWKEQNIPVSLRERTR